MSRRALRVLLLTAALTAGSGAYAVLSLPEPGDVRRSVVPFRQWAEQHSLPKQAMIEQCATVNETADGRAWCFRQQIGEARQRWLRAQAGMAEAWTESELSLKRDLYLVVGAYVLFTLAIGGLTVRTVTRLI
jgi:hypothetical protein